jgi:hypothetical protein
MRRVPPNQLESSKERGRRAHLSWAWKDWRRLSQGDGLDHPMHHRAGVVHVDIDGGAQDGVPGGGAEEAVGDVEHEDVVGLVRHPDGLPEDVALLRGVVGGLDGGVAGVDQRHPLGREGEVPAVGGAVEEDVAAAAAPDPVHPPRRVQGRAARAQGDARPVLVGVEVRAVHAVPQPHVRPVTKELHRCSAGGGAAASEGRQRTAARERVS